MVWVHVGSTIDGECWDFNHPNDVSSIRGCMKNFKLSKRTPRLLTLTSRRIDPVRPNVLSSGHESCLLGGLRS